MQIITLSHTNKSRHGERTQWHEAKSGSDRANASCSNDCTTI